MMAIQIRLEQNNSTREDTRGKWFARTQKMDEVGLDALAERMSRNCSMKKSDILGVMTELPEAITSELQNGNTVVIPGFGRFHATVESECVDSPEDFDMHKHIRDVKVKFLPTRKQDPVTGKMQQIWTKGMSLCYLPGFMKGIIHR